MARHPMTPGPGGNVETPPRIAPGEMTPAFASWLSRFLFTVAKKLNGGLSLGQAEDGAGAGNLDAQWRLPVTCVAAAEPVPIPHGLGRVPAGYLVVWNTAGSCWYVPADKPPTEDLLWLTSDSTGAVARVIVF